MFESRSRWKLFPDFFVENGNPHAVLLMNGHVREGAGQFPGKAILAHAGSPVRHGPRSIHQQVDSQVALLLVLPDVEPFVPGVHAPVEVPKVVARNVLTVVGKLDTESFQRTPMRPRQRPLDRKPRAEGQIAQTHNLQGVKQSVDPVIHGQYHT